MKRVDGAIAATSCRCGPNRIPYTDAEGPRCLKCGDPLKPQLSRMTRDWLRRRIAEERARQSA